MQELGDISRASTAVGGLRSVAAGTVVMFTASTIAIAASSVGRIVVSRVAACARLGTIALDHLRFLRECANYNIEAMIEYVYSNLEHGQWSWESMRNILVGPNLLDLVDPSAEIAGLLRVRDQNIHNVTQHMRQQIPLCALHSDCFPMR